MLGYANINTSLPFLIEPYSLHAACVRITMKITVMVASFVMNG